jgi:AcrR family transcriptional regulator
MPIKIYISILNDYKSYKLMGIQERKQREREKRREAIIDSAEAVFFEHGFEHGSMDQVAEYAELSKGTLYLYFKSKEELHWAITRRGMTLLKKMLEKRIQDKPSGAEKLVEMGAVFIEFSEKHEDYFHSLLFFEGKDIGNLVNMEGNGREAFLENSPIQLLHRVVEEAMEDGSIRHDLSVAAVTHTLWSQTLGVLQVVTRKKAVFDFYNVGKQDIMTSHVEILRNGLLKKS